MHGSVGVCAPECVSGYMATELTFMIRQCVNTGKLVVYRNLGIWEAVSS